MATTKVAYCEGDWFAVPLRNGGFALGLAARVTKKRSVLGYFFGPRKSEMPSPHDIGRLAAEDAVLICIFGDLGLANGEWPIIAKHESWQREKWPLPTFGHIDIVDSNKAFVRKYSDTDLDEFVLEYEIAPEEARALPKDGLFGYGAVEITLTKLLSD
jgi:hypothetical protein